MNSNVYWQDSKLSLTERNQQNGHTSGVIWLTGLSGSGKSTLAFALEKYLFSRDIQAFVLDGDNLRHGLNRDLGFSVEDRKENIRRLGEVTKLFVEAGFIVITSFISPFREERNWARALLQDHHFFEVYVNCPLDECIKRDPKGLYQQAQQGLIKNFTGLDSPYEAPEHPELIINTAISSVEESLEQLLTLLKERHVIT